VQDHRGSDASADSPCTDGYGCQVAAEARRTGGPVSHRDGDAQDTAASAVLAGGSPASRQPRTAVRRGMARQLRSDHMATASAVSGGTQLL